MKSMTYTDTPDAVELKPALQVKMTVKFKETTTLDAFTLFDTLNTQRDYDKDPETFEDFIEWLELEAEVAKLSVADLLDNADWLEWDLPTREIVFERA